MSAQPKTYTAPHAVYVDNRLYAAGEPFTTASVKGDKWEAVDAGEKAAAEAASKIITVQPSLEDMDITVLRALATEKSVNSSGLSKKDLITAIKAADEVHL
jgi:hypothetical protein